MKTIKAKYYKFEENIPGIFVFPENVTLLYPDFESWDCDYGRDADGALIDVTDGIVVGGSSNYQNLVEAGIELLKVMDILVRATEARHISIDSVGDELTRNNNGRLVNVHLDDLTVA